MRRWRARRRTNRTRRSLLRAGLLVGLASSSFPAALQVGKIKNKVIKLTGELQQIAKPPPRPRTCRVGRRTSRLCSESFSWYPPWIHHRPLAPLSRFASTGGETPRTARRTWDTHPLVPSLHATRAPPFPLCARPFALSLHSCLLRAHILFRPLASSHTLLPVPPPHSRPRLSSPSIRPRRIPPAWTRASFVLPPWIYYSLFAFLPFLSFSFFIFHAAEAVAETSIATDIATGRCVHGNLISASLDSPIPELLDRVELHTC
ncbi:hypothetical protein C8R44DRAFT_351002 [Mycena epipterygia]|nr:hypothetical protein C8R44DRAFT_351002 [Mycena epipterygia]